MCKRNFGECIWYFKMLNYWFKYLTQFSLYSYLTTVIVYVFIVLYWLPVLFSSCKLFLITMQWKDYWNNIFLFHFHYQVSKWVGSSNSNHGFLITATHLVSNRIEHNLVAFAKGQGNLQESRNALLVLFTNSNKRRSSSFVPSSTSKFTQQ